MFVRKFLFAAILLAIILAAASAPALAEEDCMQICMISHQCDAEYETGYADIEDNLCHPFLNNCENECHAVVMAYGAIAYDATTGAWGLSDTELDQEAASKSAIKYCSNHGPYCAVADTFVNSCAAVSLDSAGILSWAQAQSPDEAQAATIALCQNKGGMECHVSLSHCYFP